MFQLIRGGEMKIKDMSRKQLKRIECFNCTNIPCSKCALKLQPEDQVMDLFCVQTILGCGYKDRLIENGVSIDMRRVR